MSIFCAVEMVWLSWSTVKVSAVVSKLGFLHISSSWVKISFHTENQLPRLSGSAVKV